MCPLVFSRFQLRSDTGPSCNRGFADTVLVVYGVAYLLVFLAFGVVLRNVIDGLRLKLELRALALISLVALIPWYVQENIYV